MPRWMEPTQGLKYLSTVGDKWLLYNALDMTALTLSPRLLHVALKESRADSAL